MNFRLIALAALAAAGSAHAMSPADIVAARSAGTLKEVRIFGASAQTPGLLAYMKDICGTVDTYNIGSDHYAYSCVTTKAAKTGTAGYPIGTPLLVVKRDAGGSVYGTTPVVAKRAQKSLFVNTTDCTAPYVAGTTMACASTAAVLQVPHAGISDVEPTMATKAFKINGVAAQYINMPTGLDDSGNAWTPPPSVTALDTAAMGQTAFGLGVSSALYAKLQTAQGTTGVPTISRAAVAGILSGFIRGTSGYSGWSSITGDAADDSKLVTICRRTQGSGTQTVSNLFFLNAGDMVDTSLGMLAPLAAPAGTAANTYYTGLPGVQIFEGSGTGNVATCLTQVNGDSSGYAIGVVTGERSDAATTWKFVKIDGAEMTTANARVGLYPFVYTSTMQFTKAADATIGYDANMIGFLKHVRANAASVEFLTTAPVPRLLALPSAWTGTCASPVTANAGTYGSCVERLDFASKYNPASFIYGLAATKNYKTNSAASLRLVK